MVWKTYATYDPETLIVTGSLKTSPETVRDTPNIIEVPDDFDAEHLDAWGVSGDPRVLHSRARIVEPDEVNAERDRRVASNFAFMGHAFDYDEASKLRIAGATSLAGFAVNNKAKAGDRTWFNPTLPTSEFAWLSADNATVPMDAQQCFALGEAAARHESAHVYAARALKNVTPIPIDFRESKYWP